MNEGMLERRREERKEKRRMAIGNEGDERLGMNQRIDGRPQYGKGKWGGGGGIVEEGQDGEENERGRQRTQNHSIAATLMQPAACAACAMESVTVSATNRQHALDTSSAEGKRRPSGRYIVEPEVWATKGRAQVQSEKRMRARGWQTQEARTEVGWKREGQTIAESSSRP
jgi:hypothetical protein